MIQLHIESKKIPEMMLQPLAKIVGVELVESELPCIREVRDFLTTVPINFFESSELVNIQPHKIPRKG